MTSIITGQFILILIQLIVIWVYTYKRDELTEAQAQDYRKASWACCGGVWILFLIGLMF